MKALSVATYAALKAKVRETLLLGQKKIEEAKVRTYWETGRLINEHVLANKDRADYGKQVVLKLSADLGISETVLYRCMRFSKQFPILASRPKFSWSHYRVLMTVPERKKMLEFIRKAENEEWTAGELEAVIRGATEPRGLALFSQKKVPDPFLQPPVPGSFWTYKIIKPETIHSRSNELLIDLGFSTVLELNRISGTKFKPDTIVTSVKDAKGNYSLKSPSPRPLPEGEGKNSVPLPRGEDKGEGVLYTYQAFIERVIDGDTLKVEIDLGFNTRIRQTIRLRAIDCPEMDTQEGVAAKKFVESALRGLDFITLKTIKPDKYDRYLGDVFCSARGGRQTYLNNLLLENGHAVRVRE